MVRDVTLRSIAGEHGITDVRENPALSGSKTLGQLVSFPDRVRVIELRPGIHGRERVFAVFHELGHAKRDEEEAENPDYQLEKLVLRLYHRHQDEGGARVPDLETLYQAEERRVNSIALDLLIHHFGPLFISAEEIESLGFQFHHRT